jgi:hypothetical protein
MEPVIALIEALVREAFGLLLEIRAQREAPQHLAQAISCLKILPREADAEEPLVLLSVRAVRIRKPQE